MALCLSLTTTGKLQQAATLAKNVVETFSERHYFSDKETFPMVCHKIWVDIKKVKVAPF